MENSFESDLEFNDEILKYVGITNLDFDTPLTTESLDKVKKLIFSVNTIAQVVFRDDIRIDDIEHIKHILELSPMIRDEYVEKLILRKNSKEELKRLLSMPYENPSSWALSYEVNNGNFQLTSLPDYRKMEEYINVVLSCIKSDYSQIEKIKEVYDFIKLLDLDSSASSRLPDIISTRKTSSLGYNLLFKEILKRIDINVYIGKIKRNNKTDYISLIYIDDSKYNIKGFYICDPVTDSVPKRMYKNEVFRKINYNFFLVTLKDLISVKESDDNYIETLSLFLDTSYDYLNRHISRQELNNLESTFNMKLDVIYEGILNTPRIKEDVILNIITSTYHKEDFITIDRDPVTLIRDNYLLRQKEIFDFREDSDNQLIIHDI